MKFTKLLLCATLFSMGMNAQAQDSEQNDFKGYWFLQLQGGINNNLDNADFNKLISPAAQLGVGYQFTPAFALRLGVSGWEAKGGFSNNDTYKWKYVAPTLDLKFNLFNAFCGYNPNRFFNMNVLVGGGVNIAWDNDDNIDKQYGLYALNREDYNWDGTKARFVGRAGLDFDFRLSKNVSINVEAMANAISDKYNSQADVTNDVNWDWYFTGLVGVKVDLGKKAAPKKVEDTAALSLYEQKEQEVGNRMNVWMKRMKGESKTDYMNRLSDEGIKTQRLEYSKSVSTEMAGNRANATIKDLQYSSNSQLLGVEFEDMPSITLAVPKSDIKDIKGTKDLQFTNTVYDLNPGDQFEVIYTDVINPATGKKYTYIKTRDAKFVKTEGYTPLAAVQEEMVNGQRLKQAANTNAAKEVKSKEVPVDNTIITVQTERTPKPNGKADYKVIYNYDVKEGFSVSNDFAPGKYEAERCKASNALLKVINESLAGEFAPYVKSGYTVNIKYQGSADASPINGKIAYNGKYGDIKDQPVNINGQTQNLSVTRAGGITSNEQLSLLRAISVKNYILKNVKALKDMTVEDSFNVEVSPNEGPQFRRVSVEFLFPDAQ